MTARSTWAGSITFGMVNVPVGLYAAARPQDLRFNQLHAGCGGRIKQQKVCAIDGDILGTDDIVKGFEVAKDRYVIVTAEDLESVKVSGGKALDLEVFVDESEIDPAAFERTYLVAPGAGGEKAFALLHRALLATSRIGVGQIVMGQRQKLVAIRATAETLVASTLYYADEIVAATDLPMTSVEPAEREQKMAAALIEALSGPFDHGGYQDDYRDGLMDIIRAKADGVDVPGVADEAPPAPVADLMAALESSLAAARKAAA
jgi:DNA end-binding protein Ku